MRDYEIVFVFRQEMELFERAMQQVKDELQNANVEITKEEDMGTRELAYSVKKETSGHYYLIEARIDPENVNRISEAVRLIDPVLKHLFVRKE